MGRDRGYRIHASGSTMEHAVSWLHHFFDFSRDEFWMGKPSATGHEYDSTHTALLGD